MIEIKAKHLSPSDEFTLDHGTTWHRVMARPVPVVHADWHDDDSVMPDDLAVATSTGTFFLDPNARVVVR